MRSASCSTPPERQSAALADVLWSPSAYLLDWIGQQGWTLPARTVVQQYVIPEGRAVRPEAADTTIAPPALRSLVFFGRLEERKGLHIFLDAVDRLAGRLAAEAIEVVFLGKEVMLGRISSRDLIAARARRAGPFHGAIVGGLTQPEAIAFLREPGRLAVMASPADNSPCTVYEAMEFAIPFIAAGRAAFPN